MKKIDFRGFRHAATVALACVGLSASADLLYWTVTDAVGDANSGKEGDPISFSYATVKAGGADSDPLHIYDQSGDTGYWRLYAADTSDNYTSTGAAYAGQFDSDTTSNMLFELWDDSDNRVGWQTYSLSSILDNIWRGSVPSATGATPMVVHDVVPEPTSGLLLLLGVAGLALRRRRRAVCGVVAALACCSAFAAANDALISFSTKGVDRYADGSAVIDGECYALVWTAAGSDGAAIAADGSVKGGEIVLTAPVAKGGRCPTVMFEVAADDIETKYKNGTWSVYLLDTRRYGADGSVTLAGCSGGRPVAVNAAGLVAGSSVKLSSGGISDAAVAAAASASSATAVPEGTPRPEIAGIRVDGANVFVTVRGTVPHLAYGLKSGETPSEVSEPAGAPRSGEDSGEIILVAPVKKGGGFFKVERR